MTEVPLLEHAGRLMPRPKFWTPRDEAWPSRGPRQHAFSRIWLGRPAGLMPWQSLVADVSGEYDPATGYPRHPLVVVTVQRQAGKSDLALSQIGERSMARPGFRAWYTAQTGGDARDQFLKFKEDVVEGTPLARLIGPRGFLVGNGREAMKWPNKSQLRPYPPGPGALHGKQVDRNDVDEAWWFDEDEGAALMQAAGPAKLTRPWAQTFIWSAGGTASSTWLASLVARGRAGDPGICYFEFGIPDDLPVDDLEAIARWHPAYGHTISQRSIEILRGDVVDDAEFARGAGNRWTEVIGSAIPGELWKALRDDTEIPADVPLSWGAARAADGSQVVIAAAAVVEGRVLGEIVDIVPAFDAHLEVKAWVDGPLIVDPTGPSAGLHEALSSNESTKRRLMDFPPRGAAVTRFNDALHAPSRPWRYRHAQALDDAAKVAGQRQVGDGGVAWARVAAGAPIAAIEALNWACYAAENRPTAPKPDFRFSG